MRADLILDMTGAPSGRFQVVDNFYQGLGYRLLDLTYAAEPLRVAPPDTPVALPTNPLAEPDLVIAERHAISFGGGMMSGMMGGGGMGGGMMGGMMRGMRPGGVRSEEGRVGEGCGRTCRYRGSPDH